MRMKMLLLIICFWMIVPVTASADSTNTEPIESNEIISNTQNKSEQENTEIVIKRKRCYVDDELLQEYTEEIGTLYNIDPFLLQAICERESSKNINAENGNCKGLMQVSLKWHKDRMEKLSVTDLFDPYSNILVAADFLAELFETNDDPAYVLMRYNMKKSTANKLYADGIISKYAKDILNRTEELRIEYEEKIEKLRLLDKQKQKASAQETLPGSGIEAWI